MYWTEIHRPTKFEQMIGNEEVRLSVLKWLLKWFPGTKPLLLLGPPGVGKTTLVKILSTLLNYDLIELNASDTRNKIQLEKMVNPLLNNYSLLGKKILLFLDEVDGISGREDTGGLDFIIEVIKSSSHFPIILAANSTNQKMKNLSKLCKIIKFQLISPYLLLMFLNYILGYHQQRISLGEKLAIVKLSKGDVRTMINLLQTRCSGYDNQLSNTGFQIEISVGINGLFSSENKNEFMKILSNLDGNFSDPRYGLSSEERRKDIINSLFTSFVTSKLNIGDLSTLLDRLSSIDIFVSRIHGKRLWNLLRYMNSLITKQLSDECQNKGIAYNQYALNWYHIGTIFSRGQSIRNIILILSKYFHVSSSTFGSLYFPFLLKIMSNNKIDINEFIFTYSLDSKYLEIFSKEIERMKKVESI